MEEHGGPAKRKRRCKPEPYWAKYYTATDRENQRIAYWHTVSLTDVGIPVRLANNLEQYGILTVGDLTKVSLNELAEIPNLGEITMKKCRQLLVELKLPIKEEI
jgi:DNA-directed RNA polymerase alpha subunit